MRDILSVILRYVRTFYSNRRRHLNNAVYMKILSHCQTGRVENQFKYVTLFHEAEHTRGRTHPVYDRTNQDMYRKCLVMTGRNYKVTPCSIRHACLRPGLKIVILLFSAPTASPRLVGTSDGGHGGCGYRGIVHLFRRLVFSIDGCDVRGRRFFNSTFLLFRRGL